MDGICLVALTVVAIVVGKPLSYLNCQVIGSASVAESAQQLSTELKSSWNQPTGKVTYSNWIGANKSTCYEMKVIWGLSIAMTYVELTVPRHSLQLLTTGQHSLRFLCNMQCVPLASQQSIESRNQGHGRIKGFEWWAGCRIGLRAGHTGGEPVGNVGSR